MPLFNHEKFVAEAVQSVRKQRFADWELIVVDDGSTDHSGEIVDKLAAQDSRIRVIHQKNAGSSVARNSGMAQAAGQWIALLDSDDTWFESTLQDYANYIQTHPESQFIYGFTHRLRYGTQKELPGTHQDRITGIRELFNGIYFESSCVCFHRDLIALAGMFRSDLPPLEDYEYFLRMGLHTSYHPLGKPTGIRRRHLTNISKPSGKNRLLEAKVLTDFVNQPAVKGLLPRAEVDYRLARVYCSAGREFRRSGNRNDTIRCLQESLARRFTVKAWLNLLVARIGI